MDEPYLSWPEATWHIMQYTICANYLFVPELAYETLGRSAWLLPLIAIPSAVIGSWAVYAIHIRFPRKRIGQFLPELVGKPVSVLILLTTSLMWAGGAAIDAVVFSQYVQTTVLQFTPINVSIAATAIILVMVGFLGLKTLTRLVDALFFVVFPFEVFVWIGALFMGRFEYSNALPVSMADFVHDPLGLVVLSLNLYHGYSVIFITGPSLNPPGRGALRAGIAGTLLAVPAFLSFVAYPILTFGWPFAHELTYPVASLLEVIAPRTPYFPLRRFDYVLTTFFRFIMVIAAVSYFYSAVQTLTDIFRPQSERPHPAAVLALGVIAVAFPYIVRDLHVLTQFTRFWMTMGAVAYVITLVLAILATRKKAPLETG